MKKILTIAIAALTLGGCTDHMLDQDTEISSLRAELHSGVFDYKNPTATFSDNALRSLAEAYRANGDGPLKLTVEYDPRSQKNTAARATDEAIRMTDSLRRYGVSRIVAGVAPVEGMGDTSLTAIGYMTVVARAPTGCGTLGGLDGQPTGHHPDYRYGCAIEGQIARQIARPGDLAGRGGMDVASGRRNANIVETYQSGAPNEALDGETVSGD